MNATANQLSRIENLKSQIAADANAKLANLKLNGSDARFEDAFSAIAMSAIAERLPAPAEMRDASRIIETLDLGIKVSLGSMAKFNPEVKPIYSAWLASIGKPNTMADIKAWIATL